MRLKDVDLNAVGRESADNLYLDTNRFIRVHSSRVSGCEHALVLCCGKRHHCVINGPARNIEVRENFRQAQGEIRTQDQRGLETSVDQSSGVFWRKPRLAGQPCQY